MNSDVKEILTDILENQKKALEMQKKALKVQQEALEIHKIQMAESEERIKKSFELQQHSVAYQTKIYKFIIPLIIIVIIYGIYLFFKV